MIIRNGVESDIESIESLVKTEFCTNEDIVAEKYKNALSKNTLLLVAEHDMNRIAFIFCYFFEYDEMVRKYDFVEGYIENRTVLYISSIIVANDYRKKGIGGKLLNEALAVGRSKGYKQALAVLVESNNEVMSKGIFLNEGFNINKRIEHLWGNFEKENSCPKCAGLEQCFCNGLVATQVI